MLATYLVLVGCGGDAGDAEAAMAAKDRAASSAEPSRVQTVRVIEVQPQRVVDPVLLAADLLPARRAVLAAEVTGSVDAVRVEAGDSVRRGQQLVAVDTRGLEQRVSEAKAVDRQRQTQFERAKALLERQSITKNQMLDAVTQRDIASSQLASAELELTKSRITAPWSGTVGRRHVEVGDYVMPGQPVIELLDVSTLEVQAPVSAADVPFLRPGLEAQVRVDGFGDRTFTGRVVRLGAELDAQSRTLDIEIELANTDGMLKPGMAAWVELPRQVFDAALMVPLDAVVELADEQVLYVVDQAASTASSSEARTQARSVTLGPVIDASVVIASGLEAGDRVIVAGQQRVSPGQRVTVEPSAELQQP